MFYIPMASSLNENSIGTPPYNQEQAPTLQQGKVKYRKIIPYNISDYLTPLALAV